MQILQITVSIPRCELSSANIYCLDKNRPYSLFPSSCCFPIGNYCLLQSIFFSGYSGTHNYKIQHSCQASLKEKCYHLSVLHRNWTLLTVWQQFLQNPKTLIFSVFSYVTRFIFLSEQSKHRWFCSPQAMIHTLLYPQSTNRCELILQRHCAVILLLSTIWSQRTVYYYYSLLCYIEIPTEYESVHSIECFIIPH